MGCVKWGEGRRVELHLGMRGFNWLREVVCIGCWVLGQARAGHQHLMKDQDVARALLFHGMLMARPGLSRDDWCLGGLWIKMRSFVVIHGFCSGREGGAFHAYGRCAFGVWRACLASACLAITYSTGSREDGGQFHQELICVASGGCSSGV